MPSKFQPHTLSFLGLEDSDTDYGRAKFVVMPVPYEQTTTYRKGTRSGPQAILEASYEVELYDEELQTESYTAGVHTIAAMEFKSADSRAMVEQVYSTGLSLLEDGKIICMLGGEHSISSGMTHACHDKFENLSIVQLDAHADLRESYQENPHNHACVMKRIRDFNKSTFGIGIRNYSKEEADYIRADKVKILHAAEMLRDDGWINELIGQLQENVYLTIDCDYFDPAVMPGVGTPEPGGGQWYQTLKFLHKLIARRNVVSFDVVELAPIPDNNVSEFTAAKLIYKIMGYIVQAS